MRRLRRLPLATGSEHQRRLAMTNTEDNVTTAPAKRGRAHAPLAVLVIGTGFSGVCIGIKLLEQGISHFRIYEKAQGIGGTWYENTYPGAACDVPSHFINTLYPKNARAFKRQLVKVRFDDFDLIEPVRSDKAA